MTSANAPSILARTRTRRRSARPGSSLTRKKEDLDPSEGLHLRARSAYAETQKNPLIIRFGQHAGEGPDEDREEDDRLLRRHRDPCELLVGEGGDPDPRRVHV